MNGPRTSRKLLAGATAAFTIAALGASVLPVSAVEPEPAPFMVKNIKPGYRASNPSDLTAIGGLLYFTASDGKHGREPWVSDGTAQGTHIIKNISPGSYSSNASDFTLVGDRVFFTAQDGNGRELWVTDGTPAGTFRVKDIRPGDKSSKPTELTALGNKLFFSANDGPHGQELWKSDGTESGTVMVKDIQPGKAGSAPRELTEYMGRIYFVEHYMRRDIVDAPCCKLLRSDGTAAGTRPVLDRDASYVYGVSELTRSGSLLYFTAIGDSFDLRLWRTNGTPSGTKPVSGAIRPEELTDVNGQLFFVADRDALYKSDGTKAGTQLIEAMSEPSQLTAVGNFLFFTSMELDGMQPLWVSNGTPQGTDYWNSANNGNGYSYSNLTNVNDTLYYTFEPTGWLLWIDCSLYDGDCSQYTWQKNVVDNDLASTTSASDRFLTDVDGTLFYSASDWNGEFGTELWAYAP